MELEPIIGLEIHVQLKTRSKMFCSCSAEVETARPNSLVCPICMGQPGTLPVINRQAVRFAHRVCLALNFKINKFTKFDRKNYFYPDLPKGYQISQYDLPIGENGVLSFFVNDIERRIGIERIHLEEDTGKLIHPPGKKYSLVDYNRAGVPLIEIVSRPEIRSPIEAKKFVQELQLVMRYLKVSDADMEKGQLRCDANISLRPVGEDKLYPKVEIKNLNSFRALERALDYEIKRQTELWERGVPPQKQETRGWDEEKGVTVEQRVKEEVSDYRYFPEPDLPPLNFSDTYLEKIKTEEIPELPFDKRKRFKKEYGLPMTEINILVDDVDFANYTEQVISELREWVTSLEELDGTREEIWQKSRKKLIKLVIAWVINRLKPLIDRDGIDIRDCLVTPENMAELITIVYQGKINSTVAQQVLQEMVKTGGDPSVIIEDRDLTQLSDKEDLLTIVEQVIKNNPKQVEEYRKGKVNVIQFLIGQVMKETKGRADPEIAKENNDNRLLLP